MASTWDAVADGAVLQEQGVALVRDGGLFVGVRPSAVPAQERGVTVRVVVTQPDGARLARLLDATASGHLPARVHAVLPLDQAADALRGRQGRSARKIRPSPLRPSYFTSSTYSQIFRAACRTHRRSGPGRRGLEAEREPAGAAIVEQGVRSGTDEIGRAG